MFQLGGAEHDGDSKSEAIDAEMKSKDKIWLAIPVKKDKTRHKVVVKESGRKFNLSCPACVEEERKDLEDESSSGLEFPTEVLELCLARLPIRSIAIARTVCKSWFSLLSLSPHSSLNCTIYPAFVNFTFPLLNDRCYSHGQASTPFLPNNPTASPLLYSQSNKDLGRNSNAKQIPEMSQSSPVLSTTLSHQVMAINLPTAPSTFSLDLSPSHTTAHLSLENTVSTPISKTPPPVSQHESFHICTSTTSQSSSTLSPNSTQDVSPSVSVLSFSSSLQQTSKSQSSGSPLQFRCPPKCLAQSSSVLCPPSKHSLCLPPHLLSVRKSLNAQEPWLFVLGWLPLHTVRRKAVIQAYDPSFDRWHSRAAEILHGRSFYSVVAAGGLIYIIGGCQEVNRPLASVLVYNPLMNTWKDAAPMLHGRSKPAAGVFKDIFNTMPPTQEEDNFRDCFGGKQKIIVAGGEGGLGEELHSAEIYDPATDSWQEIEKLPYDYKGVEGHAAVYNNKFFVCSQPTKIAVYDLRRGVWDKSTVVHGTPYPHGWRGNFRLVACEGHSLLMVGVPWGPEGQKSMKMWKFEEEKLQWLEMVSPQSSGAWSNEEIWSSYAAAVKEELYVFSLSESPGFSGAVGVFSSKGMKWHQVADLQDRGPPRKLAVMVHL